MNVPRAGLGRDEAFARIRLLRSPNVGPVTYRQLLRRFGDAASALAALPDLATRGGGEFFGDVGSFEDGFEFDAVVLDDSATKHPQPLTVRERLERAVYLGLDLSGIAAKYARGAKVL